MKILMLAPFADSERKEGTSGHVFSLINWLRDQDGMSITLASFGTADSLEEDGECKVITLRKRQWYRLLPFVPIAKISRIVKNEKPDILHVQGSTLSYPLLYALVLAQRDMRMVITIHGHPIEEGLLEGWLKKGTIRHMVARWAESRIPSRFSGVVTVTSGLRNDLIGKYPSYAQANFHVVPNGVNPEEFSPANLDYSHESFLKMSHDRGSLTVLNAKALIQSNGQEFLIRAFETVAREVQNSRLLLIGDGPELPRLKSLAIDLGLTENVHFLGRIPNDMMPSAIAIADIVVIPSLSISGVEEGSSLNLLEAMASAKPVIASDIGGLSETISDKETGLLVPQRDSDAIANAILRLFQEKDIALRIGRQSREWILRERTWEHVALKYSRIYASLMSDAKSDS